MIRIIGTNSEGHAYAQVREAEELIRRCGSTPHIARFRAWLESGAPGRFFMMTFVAEREEL